MLWAVTGAELAFPQFFRGVVSKISPLTTFEPPQSVLYSGEVQPEAGLARLIARAQILVPGAKMGRLILASIVQHRF